MTCLFFFLQKEGKGVPLTRGLRFRDPQGPALAGAAGPDVDAGFTQGRGDLADLQADRAHVLGQITGGHAGFGTDPPVAEAQELDVWMGEQPGQQDLLVQGCIVWRGEQLSVNEYDQSAQRGPRFEQCAC